MGYPYLEVVFVVVVDEIKNSNICDLSSDDIKNNTVNIRAKFIKGKELKYISHLDIMRTFQRALRRARISISYSEGFNPKPYVVFGLPLAVGVTSEAEYADFRLDEHMEPENFMQRLNLELPSALKLQRAKIKLGKDNIMANISHASYKIFISAPSNIEIIEINEVKKILNSFIKLDNILVPKYGKKEEKNKYGNYNKNRKKNMAIGEEIDIKPMIQSLDVDTLNTHFINDDNNSDDNYNKNDNNENNYKKNNKENIFYNFDELNGIGFIVSTLLSAGSEKNLKPETLINALNMYAKIDFEIIHIHRTGLFVKIDNNILDPLHPLALEW